MISFFGQDKNFAHPGFYNGDESSFINVDLNKSLDCSFINEGNGSCQREDDRYNFESNNEKDNNSFTYEYFPQSLEDELNGTRLEGDNELIKFFEEKEKNSENEKHNISEENTSQNSKTNTENNLTDNSSNSSNSKTTKEIIFTITKDAKVKRVPIIPQEPEIELEQEQEKETPKLLGQKQERTHTKYSFDNLVRKIKSKLFASILIILNKSLKDKKEKASAKENQKQKKSEVMYNCFLKLDQKIILQTNVKENLELFNKQLREIFSEDVSSKVQNFSKHGLKHNKIFIEEIKNDENRTKTNAILDMTFFECLEHFRGTKSYPALNGLEEEYEKVIEDLSIEEDYKGNFIEHLKNLEIMFQNKKPRNKKKKEDKQ